MILGDIHRYHEIANSPGTPYRDFRVEFPPLTYLFFELFPQASPRDAIIPFVISQFACEVLVAALLGITWRPAVAFNYLVLGTPLIVFVYTRVDLFSVVLAVAGAALVTRRRQGTGGITLALGGLAKLWPLALAATLVRHPRALVALLTATAASTLGWLVWAGPDGPLQVLTFRGAEGIAVESVPGSLIHLFSTEKPALEAGAWRIDHSLPWVPVVGALLFLAIAVRVVRQSSEGTTPFGLPALTIISALLVCSPLISPQFVTWLLPWAAVARGFGDQRAWALTLAASVMSVAVVLSLGYILRGFPWAIALVLLRNGSLVALVCHGTRKRAFAPPASP